MSRQSFLKLKSSANGNTYFGDEIDPDAYQTGFAGSIAYAEYSGHNPLVRNIFTKTPGVDASALCPGSMTKQFNINYTPPQTQQNPVNGQPPVATAISQNGAFVIVPSNQGPTQVMLCMQAVDDTGTPYLSPYEVLEYDASLGTFFDDAFLLSLRTKMTIQGSPVNSSLFPSGQLSGYKISQMPSILTINPNQLSTIATDQYVDGKASDGLMTFSTPSDDSWYTPQTVITPQTTHGIDSITTYELGVSPTTTPDPVTQVPVVTMVPFQTPGFTNITYTNGNRNFLTTAINQAALPSQDPSVLSGFTPVFQSPSVPPNMFSKFKIEFSGVGFPTPPGSEAGGNENHQIQAVLAVVVNYRGQDITCYYQSNLTINNVGAFPTPFSVSCTSDGWTADSVNPLSQGIVKSISAGFVAANGNAAAAIATSEMAITITTYDTVTPGASNNAMILAYNNLQSPLTFQVVMVCGGNPTPTAALYNKLTLDISEEQRMDALYYKSLRGALNSLPIPTIFSSNDYKLVTDFADQLSSRVHLERLLGRRPLNDAEIGYSGFFGDIWKGIKRVGRGIEHGFEDVGSFLERAGGLGTKMKGFKSVLASTSGSTPKPAELFSQDFEQSFAAKRAPPMVRPGYQPARRFHYDDPELALCGDPLPPSGFTVGYDPSDHEEEGDADDEQDDEQDLVDEVYNDYDDFEDDNGSFSPVGDVFTESEQRVASPEPTPGLNDVCPPAPSRPVRQMSHFADPVPVAVDEPSSDIEVEELNAVLPRPPLITVANMDAVLAADKPESLCELLSLMHSRGQPVHKNVRSALAQKLATMYGLTFDDLTPLQKCAAIYACLGFKGEFRRPTDPKQVARMRKIMDNRLTGRTFRAEDSIAYAAIVAKKKPKRLRKSQVQKATAVKRADKIRKRRDKRKSAINPAPKDANDISGADDDIGIAGLYIETNAEGIHLVSQKPETVTTWFTDKDIEVVLTNATAALGPTQKFRIVSTRADIYKDASRFFLSLAAMGHELANSGVVTADPSDHFINNTRDFSYRINNAELFTVDPESNVSTTIANTAESIADKSSPGATVAELLTAVKGSFFQGITSNGLITMLMSAPFSKPVWYQFFGYDYQRLLVHLRASQESETSATTEFTELFAKMRGNTILETSGQPYYQNPELIGALRFLKPSTQLILKAGTPRFMYNLDGVQCNVQFFPYLPKADTTIAKVAGVVVSERPLKHEIYVALGKRIQYSNRIQDLTAEMARALQLTPERADYRKMLQNLATRFVPTGSVAYISFIGGVKPMGDSYYAALCAAFFPLACGSIITGGWDPATDGFAMTANDQKVNVCSILHVPLLSCSEVTINNMPKSNDLIPIANLQGLINQIYWSKRLGKPQVDYTSRLIELQTASTKLRVIEKTKKEQISNAMKAMRKLANAEGAVFLNSPNFQSNYNAEMRKERNDGTMANRLKEYMLKGPMTLDLLPNFLENQAEYLTEIHTQAASAAQHYHDWFQDNIVMFTNMFNTRLNQLIGPNAISKEITANEIVAAIGKGMASTIKGILYYSAFAHNAVVSVEALASRSHAINSINYDESERPGIAKLIKDYAPLALKPRLKSLNVDIVMSVAHKLLVGGENPNLGADSYDIFAGQKIETSGASVDLCARMALFSYGGASPFTFYAELWPTLVTLFKYGEVLMNPNVAKDVVDVRTLNVAISRCHRLPRDRDGKLAAMKKYAIKSFTSAYIAEQIDLWTYVAKANVPKVVQVQQISAKALQRAYQARTVELAAFGRAMSKPLAAYTTLEQIRYDKGVEYDDGKGDGLTLDQIDGILGGDSTYNEMYEPQDLDTGRTEEELKKIQKDFDEFEATTKAQKEAQRKQRIAGWETRQKSEIAQEDFIKKLRKAKADADDSNFTKRLAAYNAPPPPPPSSSTAPAPTVKVPLTSSTTLPTRKVPDSPIVLGVEPDEDGTGLERDDVAAMTDEPDVMLEKPVTEPSAADIIRDFNTVMKDANFPADSDFVSMGGSQKIKAVKTWLKANHRELFDIVDGSDNFSIRFNDDSVPTLVDNG